MVTKSRKVSAETESTRIMAFVFCINNLFFVPREIHFAILLQSGVLIQYTVIALDTSLRCHFKEL